jgi:hypothetical protein
MNFPNRAKDKQRSQGAFMWQSWCRNIKVVVASSALLLSVVAFAQKQDLSGLWSADDGATYFILHQKNTVWWVGLSADDGGSFTNVFRGTWQPRSGEEPGDWGTVTGEWADLPRGRSLNNGALVLAFKFTGDLVKVDNGGLFRASVWKRLKQGATPDAPKMSTSSYFSRPGLTGLWKSDSGGLYYAHQVGSTLWWFGLHALEGGNLVGEIFRGTVLGNRIEGTVAFPPWPWFKGSGTNVLTLEGDQGSASSKLTATGALGYYGTGTTWTKQ